MKSIPQESNCSDCGIETDGPTCPACLSLRHLLALVGHLVEANKEAYRAYAASPGGAWGSQTARLKTQLMDLTRDIAKVALGGV
jgi:hypothetical protein